MSYGEQIGSSTHLLQATISLSLNTTFRGILHIVLQTWLSTTTHSVINAAAPLSPLFFTIQLHL